MTGHDVRIEVKRAGDDVFVDVRDALGHIGYGRCRLAAHRGLDEELRRYRRLELDARELRALGERLLDQVLLEDRLVRDAWHLVRGAAGAGPLHVTVAYGPDTEAFFGLPLELIADERGFLFARKGAWFERELLQTRPRHRVVPKRPRVLLAWAAPASEQAFDPTPHRTMLEDVFGRDAVAVLDRVTPDRLESELRAHPVDYLHLMLHGRVDWDGPLGVFEREGGAPLIAGAQRIANAVHGSTLSFAFLCMCSSAELADHALFDGIAQALVSEHGGDLPVVVAQQAPLPIAGSAELAGDFYRSLATTNDPTRAMSELRSRAVSVRGAVPPATWSVPILLARPRAIAGTAHGVAAPLAHFVGRADELASLTRAVSNNDAPPVIALLGIGGLGKTSILNHWLHDEARRSSSSFAAIVPFCAYRSGAAFRNFLEVLLRGLGEPWLVADDNVAAAIARAGELLRVRRVLVAIDGLEAWLRGWKDGIEAHEAKQHLDRDEGPVHRGLNDFLVVCAGLDNGSRLVFTSRATPLALEDRRMTILDSGEDPRGRKLRGLRTADGVELLRRLAVDGADETLAARVESFDGHPLLLTVFAAQHRGEHLDRDLLHDLPDALRQARRSAHGTDEAPAAELAQYDKKLHPLLVRLEADRPSDVPLLRAIAACVADAPREAVEHALGIRPRDAEFVNRIRGLECWGLLERYEVASGSWLAVHPMVKQHFRASVPRHVDRALGEWFAKQPVPRESCTLREAEPRIWAIHHFLRAGEFDRCWTVLTAELAGGKQLCDWFYAWGYLEYEIDIELKLLDKCSPNLRSEIRRSLAHNYTQLGDIEKAIDI